MNTQITDTLALLRQCLGDELLAVHLYGSAVAGGLKPGSDIDLLVTVRTPLRDAVRHALMHGLLGLSAWPANERLRPLEVTILSRDAVQPWRYPAMREMQFGEWLREDLNAGRIEPAMADHDLAILLSKARQDSIALIGPPADEWFDPVPQADLIRALHDTVAQWREASGWLGDETNVVLALARIWLTLSTGMIASKDLAASWLLERLPEIHRPVLVTARSVYLGHCRDDLGQRTPAVAAFIDHARKQIERLDRSDSKLDATQRNS